MTGRQRPFPILDDHVEHVEETLDMAIRGESGHLEYPDNADALCVLSDPLDGVFGRVTVPLWFCMSLVAEVSAVTCLSRNVFHSKMLASALRRVCADVPTVASAKHAFDDHSSFDLVALEFGNIQSGSKKHVADAGAGLGVTGEVALVEVFLGGAVGRSC